VLLFLLMGIVAGVATGVPIGPVNVAVIDAAYRHTLRRALATGLGGAIADMLYAGLGALGVAPILDRHPLVTPIFHGVSGVLLLVYGFLTARSQPVQVAVEPVDHDNPSASYTALQIREEVTQGFKTGIFLILLNPAALVTWVVIVRTFLPVQDTRFDGVGFALGVLLGSFAWFFFVAHLTHKGKNVLGDKAAWIPRIIGICLMGYAVWLLAKAVRFVIA
jgi:threonine/homoserine/homoserine lactone efflux protein